MAAERNRPWRSPGRHGTSTWIPARARSPNSFARVILSGFGCADKPLGIAAAGALLAYVRETQKSALPHLFVHHHTKSATPR